VIHRGETLRVALGVKLRSMGTVRQYMHQTSSIRLPSIRTTRILYKRLRSRVTGEVSIYERAR